jgi:hypothetical protein
MSVTPEERDIHAVQKKLKVGSDVGGCGSKKWD